MLSADRLIISPVLIGRAREVASLELALRTVQQGAGQVVLLAGEAGVGKSRLVAEIRRRAAAGFTVLAGQCFERDRLFPYAPLIDALRAFFAPQPAAVTDLLGPWTAELVKLLPELALVTPDLQPTSALDPEAEKRRLFEALLHCLIRLTQAPRKAPLLLILEDIHWSDETSLDFLNLLARRVGVWPIFVLATYRREEVSPDLRHLLRQLDRARQAREVVLQPLSRSDVNALVQAMLELKHPVRAEFLETVYALTEGNPFFIEEVLKSLFEAGDIFYADSGRKHKPMQELHIPRSVQDAVQQRIAQLSAGAHQILTLAAVAGRRFDFALLQQVAGYDEHELLPVIKELVAAQLVVAETAEQFAFRHALTQQTVSMELLARERKTLHRMIAAAIERVYADALDTRAVDLSYHCYEAGEWAKALDYARQAGAQAQALYAPRAAVEHFTRAMAAAQHLGQAWLLAPLYRDRGLAYETLGDFEHAAADLEVALAQARAGDDQLAEWQGLIDLGFLWASRDYARTGEYFQRVLELGRRLDDPATLGHSLNRLGNWYANVEQPGEGLRYHQEALDLFQRLNDRRGLVETLDLLGMTSQLNSDLIQSHMAYQRAIDLWRELGDRRGLVSSLASLPLCAASYFKNLDVPATGLLDAARAAEEAVRIAREIGWRAGEAYALWNLAMCLGPLGEYARALEAAQTARWCAEDIEHRQWIAAAHTILGILYLDLLAFDAARSHLEQALALARAVGSAIWTGSTTGYLVSAYAAQGEFGRAESLLKDVLASDTPMQTQAQRLCWYARAELALATGQVETALHIADGLIALVPNLTAETVIARVWKLRGEALAALGKTGEAETVLQAAQVAASKQEERSLLWRIHAALGRLYQAQGRQDDAEAEFSAAAELIQTLAANVPDEALRRNFIERGMATLPRLPSPSPVAAEKKKFGGLTSREREVAVLIAQGKSNREIAAELVVGVRTVEAHITRILNKLGFSSRAQIAAWTVEKELARATRDDAG